MPSSKYVNTQSHPHSIQNSIGEEQSYLKSLLHTASRHQSDKESQNEQNTSIATSHLQQIYGNPWEMDKASLYEMTEGKEPQLSEKKNDVKVKMA